MVVAMSTPNATQAKRNRRTVRGRDSYGITHKERNVRNSPISSFLGARTILSQAFVIAVVVSARDVADF